MKSLPVTKYGPIVSAVCAGGFLILAVLTAMAHEKSWVIAVCAAFALGSIVLTNLQLQARHAQQAKDADSKPPA
jgi:fructose-1-phosphate kinase PfkB-like protein